MTGPDRLTEVVTMRFTADERALLEEYAAGRPLGPAIRELVTAALRPRPVRKLQSGISVNTVPGQVWAANNAGPWTENHGGPLLVTCDHPGASYATRPGAIVSGA